MKLLLRVSLCAWIGFTLVSCQTASSAANLLMAPFSMAARTLGAVGRTAGVTSSVDDPDTSSKAVAERGEMIEARGGSEAPKPIQAGMVAQQ